MAGPVINRRQSCNGPVLQRWGCRAASLQSLCWRTRPVALRVALERGHSLRPFGSVWPRGLRCLRLL